MKNITLFTASCLTSSAEGSTSRTRDKGAKVFSEAPPLPKVSVCWPLEMCPTRFVPLCAHISPQMSYHPSIRKTHVRREVINGRVPIQTTQESSTTSRKPPLAASVCALCSPLSLPPHSSNSTPLATLLLILQLANGTGSCRECTSAGSRAVRNDTRNHSTQR